ncbi:Potassium voltage-gated channel protein Shaker [Diplonema papillatum]|nr:Potassium voltage-gated channel protein Shaker [Diplonema papillatum]
MPQCAVDNHVLEDEPVGRVGSMRVQSTASGDCSSINDNLWGHPTKAKKLRDNANDDTQAISLSPRSARQLRTALARFDNALTSNPLFKDPTCDFHLGAGATVGTTFDDMRPETPAPVFTADDLTLKQKVHAVFDASSPAEEWYATVEHRRVSTGIFLLSFLMIVLSCTTFTIESLPEFYNRGLIEFYVIEAVCIGWFTVELSVRFFTCGTKRGFLRDPFNWVDIISVGPFYFDLLSSIFTSTGAKADGLIVLRTIRLTRVFRVFKLTKYSEGIQMVAACVARSTDALSLLIFLLAIAMVLFGSGIYFAEQQAATWDEANRTWIRKPEYGGGLHPIKSIPNGFWWCLVTVTSVGYGDMYPVTFWGHVVGTITMLTGLLIVAFPIIILGANFQDVQQEFKDAKHRKLRRRKDLAKQKSSRRGQSDGSVLPSSPRGGLHEDEIPSPHNQSLATTGSNKTLTLPAAFTGRLYIPPRTFAVASPGREQSEEFEPTNRDVLDAVKALHRDLGARLHIVEEILSERRPQSVAS